MRRLRPDPKVTQLERNSRALVEHLRLLRRKHHEQIDGLASCAGHNSGGALETSLAQSSGQRLCARFVGHLAGLEFRPSTEA